MKYQNWMFDEALITDQSPVTNIRMEREPLKQAVLPVRMWVSSISLFNDLYLLSFHLYFYSVPTLVESISQSIRPKDDKGLETQSAAGHGSWPLEKGISDLKSIWESSVASTTKSCSRTLLDSKSFWIAVAIRVGAMLSLVNLTPVVVDIWWKLECSGCFV